VDQVSGGYAALSAPVRASRSVSASRAVMEFGVVGGGILSRVHGQIPCWRARPAGGRTGRLSRGVGAHMSCVRSCRAGIGSTWSCPPHGVSNDGARACCRRGRNRQAEAAARGVSARRGAPLCRWTARIAGGSASGTSGIRGNQWLRTTCGLTHHQVRPAWHRWADRCHSGGSWMSRSRRAWPHLTAGSVRGTANFRSDKACCAGRSNMTARRAHGGSRSAWPGDRCARCCA
jgi:hypothetical protein